MILVALTGGIGSGKSSVSTRLVGRGAVIVDADAIARELQQPDGSVFRAMVDRWGPRIVAEDGTLDRQAVADIAFKDPTELKVLNKLVQPAVRREMARRAEEHGHSGRAVVMDTPLLAESRRPPTPGQYSGVIVVDTPLDVAVARLVAHRGLREDDAWARAANQATREQRLAIADFVVDNSGDEADLEAEVGRLWAWLATAPQVPVPVASPDLAAYQ
ncbi:MAG: dephospho-CoA kinase [Acidimicrobiia bacterium]|nr:dephospho-CoA kinase [Acidimicrobiia bacterium]